MFRTLFYGALLGSLAFAASETLAHAGTSKAETPSYKKFKIKHDVTRGQTAPELGFVSDILDMKDWKKLREGVEQPSFTSLMTEDPVDGSKTKSGGGS